MHSTTLKLSVLVPLVVLGVALVVMLSWLHLDAQLAQADDPDVNSLVCPVADAAPAGAPINGPGCPPVGGIAVDPDLGALALETPESSSGNSGLLVGIVAAVATGVVALGGAAWYAKRRRLG